jgi:hypothetical protein
VPGNAIRPPAYLPQNSGLAQMRAALRRAQQGAQGSASPAQRARATPVRKGSNAWGCLVFLAIALFASGLGQKIIAVISEFLQRK